MFVIENSVGLSFVNETKLLSGANREEVRPINGVTGYFISSMGRVFSILGKGSRHSGRTVPPYEVYGRNTRSKYLRVYLKRDSDGKRVDMYVHRLVGLHFLERKDDSSVIDHKNCNRHDNRAENLEWCSVQENHRRTYERGHIRRNKETGRMEGAFDFRSVLTEHRKPVGDKV